MYQQVLEIKPINKLDLIYSVLNNEDIKRLSPEQATFILHPINRDCFLSACPGSGKTHSVGIKIAYEIQNWISKISGIAVLSFTKNAAEEIKNRANRFLGNLNVSHPHFVGTIDSWLHSYIFHPFGSVVTRYKGAEGDVSHKLIQDGNHGTWLKNFSTNKISILDYTIDMNENPTVCDEKKKIENDPLTISTLLNKKKQFAEKGFVTYADIEYWCYKLLQQRGDILDLIAKRFPYIFIDECQDLSEIQLGILSLLKQAGVTIHLIGDLDQAIYGFRKVYPEKVIEKIDEWKMERLQLTINHRSVQQICNVVAKLGGKQQIIGTRSSLNQSCLLWVYDKKNDLYQLQEAFINLLGKRNLNVKDAIIIARGSSTIRQIKGYPRDTKLDKAKNHIVYKIASAITHWSSANFKDKNVALELFSQAIIDLAYAGKGKSGIITPPFSYSPIDWRIKLGTYLEKIASKSDFIVKETSKQIWKNWVKDILKSEFKNIWDELKDVEYSFEQIVRRLRSPEGLSDIPMSKKFLMGEKKIEIKVKVDTIHKVKGETYRAALVVSSPTKKSDGGHFTQWLQKGTEASRFAYVACSRPQDLLVLAIPEYSEEILNLGFYLDDIKDYISV